MTPWVTRLIAANVVMFFVSQFAPLVYALLALVPAYVLQRPWTLVTYMFLHGGLMHLIFNMIGLFFFGPRLEERLGGRDFLLLYFLSGLGGALLSFLLSPHAAVVGASGAVFGILVGFARFWPDAQIYIWGILPVSARAMVIGLAAIAIWSGITGAGAGVAHFAHLGGLLAGWLYLVWRMRRRKGKWNPDPQQTTRFGLPAGPSRAQLARWERIRLDELHEINRMEAERIQAKIREQGPGSLTPNERSFMDRMAPP